MSRHQHDSPEKPAPAPAPGIDGDACAQCAISYGSNTQACDACNSSSAPTIDPGPTPRPPSAEEVTKRENKGKQLKSLAGLSTWHSLGSTALSAVCTGLACFATIKHHNSSMKLNKLDPKDPNHDEKYAMEIERNRQGHAFLKGATAIGTANAAWSGITSFTNASRRRDLANHF